MTIDFYNSRLSPASRVAQMGIKHFKVEHNSKHLDIFKGDTKTPEYLSINPQHCVPTIVDGDMTLWESRAILQYLANKYAPNSSLYPTDPKKRAIIDRMLNFDFSYANSIKYALLLPVLIGAECTEQHKTTLANSLKLFETLIGDNKYVTGNDLTIADLSLVIYTHLFEVFDMEPLKEFPRIKNWYERVRKELPYFEEVNEGVIDGIKQLMADKTCFPKK